MNEEIKIKQKKGFATLSPERVKEIASMGGKKAHELGTRYKWNSETASIAGKKSVEVRRSRQ